MNNIANDFNLSTSPIRNILNKNKLRKRITSLKIGGTNNTRNKSQRKTPTHTHQRSMYMRNQLKLRK